MNRGRRGGRKRRPSEQREEGGGEAEKGDQVNRGRRGGEGGRKRRPSEQREERGRKKSSGEQREERERERRSSEEKVKDVQLLRSCIHSHQGRRCGVCEILSVHVIPLLHGVSCRSIFRFGRYERYT